MLSWVNSLDKYLSKMCFIEIWNLKKIKRDWCDVR